jgi:hypothetical protein
MVMKSGKPLREACAIDPIGDAVERGLEAVGHAGQTLLRRRAWASR